MNERKFESGFTLIEMLIVMSVIMIISIFSFHSFQTYNDQKKLDSFMKQLEEDLFFAQMMALANQKNAKVIFFEDTYIINYYENNSKKRIELTKYYSEGVKIDIFTSAMNREVIFLSNGNVQEFGRFRVKYKNLKYFVIFQLGRGRFYYE